MQISAGMRCLAGSPSTGSVKFKQPRCLYCNIRNVAKSALLTAVDARYEEDWLVIPQTVRTLLLLLYATGLRISEALALTMADVDLREAILTIRETKFYKSRLVPIGADLLDVLVRPRARQTARSRRAGAPFLSDRAKFLQNFDAGEFLRTTAVTGPERVRG